MIAYFGWVNGSRYAKYNIHLSGRDIDDVILKANGVIQKGISSDIQKDTNSTKLDLSSVIEAKVSKLVEVKIAEWLGN